MIPFRNLLKKLCELSNNKDRQYLPPKLLQLSFLVKGWKEITFIELEVILYEDVKFYQGIVFESES